MLTQVRERKLMWCDSTTDSIVWMGEDERRYCLAGWSF